MLADRQRDPQTDRQTDRHAHHSRDLLRTLPRGEVIMKIGCVSRLQQTTVGVFLSGIERRSDHASRRRWGFVD